MPEPGDTTSARPHHRVPPMKESGEIEPPSVGVPARPAVKSTCTTARLQKEAVWDAEAVLAEASADSTATTAQLNNAHHTLAQNNTVADTTAMHEADTANELVDTAVHSTKSSRQMIPAQDDVMAENISWIRWRRTWGWRQRGQKLRWRRLQQHLL